MFLRGVATALWLMAVGWAADDEPAMPRYRVDTTGFEAGEADIRAVCDAAGNELWREFSDYPLEPFVVVKGNEGPIVLFKRNDQREVVLKLDTGKAYWSQYAYQFAHEFCHILCGFREGDSSNRWFEETLCETASLYALRGMARRWKDDPPYPNWRDYRDSLRGYADDVIARRGEVASIHKLGLPAFYRTHEAALRKNPTDRELNGAMAVVLLRLFEERPSRWEAVRWLNHEPIPPHEPFAAYLARWRSAVPEKHREFVDAVAELYGVEPAK